MSKPKGAKKKTPAIVDSSPRKSTLRFYGDAFVFDTASGMFFRLSPSASLVLRSLDSGTKPDQLPALLQARYQIDRATATRDVELLLSEFSALEPLDRFAHGDLRSI